MVGELLHEDQKGFVRGRGIKDLTYNLIGAIDIASTYKVPLAAITVGTTKAFDRVNWSYLQKS